MGTLFDQSPRNYKYVDITDVEKKLLELDALAARLGCELSEVIDVAKILEMERRNSLFADNGDVWDEQIGGIGEILQDIANIMRSKD